MKKYPIFKIVFAVLIIYAIYKVTVYLLLDLKITSNDVPPKIKLSELVNISETRIDYSLNYYVNKDFVGLNAFIDKKYFITITKLGKTVNLFILISILRMIRNSIFFSFSDKEDKSGRYINLDNYPFDTNQIYYYLNDGHIFNINESNFYEIEGSFSFFNISFGNENERDFGYVGFKAKQSVSFIIYKGDFYVLNLIPIGSNSYKSLHDLSEM